MLNKSSRLLQTEILPEATGERLDRYLTTLPSIASRSRGVDLIERGLVQVDGKPVKPSQRVQAGQILTIQLPEVEPTQLQPLDRPLDILHEDEDVIVINKPSGLVVHPAAGHAQDTLVNMLIHHCTDLSMGFSESRPGIVHRLDRDTSGILVVAKNDSTHHFLAEQFRQKSVHRVYWALTLGEVRLKEFTIRSHLARHPRDRKRFASTMDQNGKLAVTHVRLLQSLLGGVSWVRCQLETGRTHQIRVHLSERKFPILADPVYGTQRKLSTSLSEKIGSKPRLFLHACELGFRLPGRAEPLSFQVGWPNDLIDAVRALGAKDV